jgi:hypothetical protein
MVKAKNKPNPSEPVSAALDFLDGEQVVVGLFPGSSKR